MRLHELSNNKIALEETLDLFHKTEETDDGYITWCSRNGTPQFQVNMYNKIIYILTDSFKIMLSLKEQAIEERKRKKTFDPFYLEPKAKQVELGRKIEGKKNFSQEHTEEEEPKKKQERLPPEERINIDGVISIDEYLNNYERDALVSSENRDFISYKHILEEGDPIYIDKYTTAYNSDIMRAILSHQ